MGSDNANEGAHKPPKAAGRSKSRKVTLSAKALSDFAQNTKCNTAVAALASHQNLDHLVAGTRFAPPFGQSPAVFLRGKQFEDILAGVPKRDRSRPASATPTYEPLLRLLRDVDAGWPLTADCVTASRSQGHWTARADRTLDACEAFLRDPSKRHAIDGAVFRRTIGGTPRFFEADFLIFGVNLAGISRPQIVIGEAKSFPVVSGQAAPENVAAARSQMAVYSLLVEELLLSLGEVSPASAISDRGILFTPKNTGLQPVATWLDLSLEGERVRRLLRQVETLLQTPVDPAVVAAFEAASGLAGTEKERALQAIVETLTNHYRPSCLQSCAFGRLCRHRARLSGDFHAVSPVLGRGAPGCRTLDEAALKATTAVDDALDPFAEVRGVLGRLFGSAEELP